MPKKRQSSSKAPSFKKIAEVLVKKAEQKPELKESLIGQTAEIVNDNEEFKMELVNSVLSSRSLKEDALKGIVDDILD